MTFFKGRILTGILISLGSAAMVQADTFTFTFNSLSENLSNYSTANASVQSYMNGLLGAGESVAVTGALVDQLGYTGEGYTVGPKNKGVVTSLTLGNTDGLSSSSPNAQPNATPDSFLINDHFHIGNEAQFDRIIMSFSGFNITSISFDFEIFPDGGCPSLTSCPGGLPDFYLNAGSSASHPMVAGSHMTGVAPGANGTYKLSPNHSSIDNPELAPQLIGTYSHSFGGSSVSYLEFVDWPATIGIDNLVITGYNPNTPTPTPEPSAIILLATSLVGAAFAWKKKLS